MCTCASCEYTDTRKEWPSGPPMGKRASDAAYAAHVRHGKQWGLSSKGKLQQPEFSPGYFTRSVHAETGGVRYTRPATRYPGSDDADAGMTAYIAAFERLNGLKRQLPAEPAPARAPDHRVQYSANDSEVGMTVKFMTVARAAQEWKISAMRVRQWLQDGRIKGAQKIGRDWLIPERAERPKAERPHGLTPRRQGSARK